MPQGDQDKTFTTHPGRTGPGAGLLAALPVLACLGQPEPAQAAGNPGQGRCTEGRRGLTLTRSQGAREECCQCQARPGARGRNMVWKVFLAALLRCVSSLDFPVTADLVLDDGSLHRPVLQSKHTNVAHLFSFEEVHMHVHVLNPCLCMHMITRCVHQVLLPCKCAQLCTWHACMMPHSMWPWVSFHHSSVTPQIPLPVLVTQSNRYHA